MAKSYRIKHKGIRNYTGPFTCELSGYLDCQINVWFSASGEVQLVAEYHDGILVPLAVATMVDANYHFDSNICKLHFHCSEAVVVAVRVCEHGTEFRQSVDPVPYELPLPLDTNSMEFRVRALLDSELSKRGIYEAPRGTKYTQYTDDYSEEDNEFGAGYQYDPDEEARLVAAAVDNVKSRYRSKRVQSSGNPSDDGSVRDGSKGDNSNGDKQPEPQNDSDKKE